MYVQLQHIFMPLTEAGYCLTAQNCGNQPSTIHATTQLLE